MHSGPERRRVFVSGTLVELWEHPEAPFGWSDQHLQSYLERNAWVLLFNAVTLRAPRPRDDCGS